MIKAIEYYLDITEDAAVRLEQCISIENKINNFIGSQNMATKEMKNNIAKEISKTKRSALLNDIISVSEYEKILKGEDYLVSRTTIYYFMNSCQIESFDKPNGKNGKLLLRADLDFFRKRYQYMRIQ